MPRSSMLLLPLALLAAGCGDSDSAPGKNVARVDPLAQLSPDTAANAELEGGWYAASTASLWTFKRDGYLTISDASSGFTWGILRFGGKAGSIELIDISSPPVAGEQAGCAHENKGEFSYAIEGDTLTLARVDDPCQLRGERLDGLVLERIETPVQPGAV